MLRYPAALALCILPWLWLIGPAAAAETDAPASANETASVDEPLTLDSEVRLPEGLFPDDLGPAGPAVIEAPSIAVNPPARLTPPPLDQLTIMLDWFPSPQHAPLLIAEARGLYRKQGLNVTLKPPADPSLPAKLLAAGEVDAALARQPLLHLRNHDDAELVRIATLTEKGLNAAIITGDPPPEDLASLATLTQGYTTREGADLVVPLLVPDSVRQADDHEPARNVHYEGERKLQDGDISVVADGFYHTLPAQLSTDGMDARVVPYEELGIPRHDGLVLMVKEDTLERRKTTWQHLDIALEQAASWIADDPERAWQTLIEAYPVLDNSANKAAWPDIVRHMALRPAAVDNRRYQRLEAFLKERGISETRLPTRALAVDPHAL